MSALLTPRMTDCSSVSDDVTDQSASARAPLRPPSSAPPPSVVVIQLRTLFSPSGVELSRSTPPSLSPLTYASVCPRRVRASVDVSKKRHFVFCLDRCLAASPISPVPLFGVPLFPPLARTLSSILSLSLSLFRFRDEKCPDILADDDPAHDAIRVRPRPSLARSREGIFCCSTPSLSLSCASARR